MKKFTPFIILLLCLFVTSAETYGSSRPSDKSKARWVGFLAPLVNLDLTEEQSKKIKALYAAYQENTASLQSDLIKKKTALQLLWMEADLNEKKIRTTLKETGDLNHNIQKEEMDFRIGLRNVFTPEQKTKYVEMKFGRHKRSRMQQQ